jgi:hypothetical protein
MNVRYTYNDNNGIGEHEVELYENFDTFLGLIGKPVVTAKNSNYKALLKEVEVYLNDEVIDMLESLFKSKLKGTITSDGKYHHL